MRFSFIRLLIDVFQNVKIQVTDDRLWQKIVHGSEEIRLALYSVVERQRMRLME